MQACTHTHTHWQIRRLPVWPWSGGLTQQWQILQDPRGSGRDRLRTEGNGSIWSGQMALRESPEERLRLDPNPQQATHWTVLPVLSIWPNGSDNIILNQPATGRIALFDCLGKSYWVLTTTIYTVYNTSQNTYLIGCRGKAIMNLWDIYQISY